MGRIALYIFFLLPNIKKKRAPRFSHRLYGRKPIPFYYSIKFWRGSQGKHESNEKFINEIYKTAYVQGAIIYREHSGKEFMVLIIFQREYIVIVTYQRSMEMEKRNGQNEDRRACTENRAGSCY